ncbi:MAG: hypothetical protein ACR2ND_06100 [Solirubrobacteraceae bacterium]
MPKTPDGVRVRERAFSNAIRTSRAIVVKDQVACPELHEVLAAIQNDYGTESRIPAVGFEQREDTVRVWFGAAWDDAARALTETFEALVTPTVGFGGDRALSSPDVPLPVSEIAHEALDLRCDPNDLAISRGQRAAAQVSLKNRGNSVLHAVASADVGLLCDTHTGVIAGSYRGWTTGTTDVLHLRPGETRSLNIVVGTDAAHDQDEGLIAPGTYAVVAPVALTSYPPVHQPRSIRWVLARGPIEVT